MSPFEAICRSLQPRNDSELRERSSGVTLPRPGVEFHQPVPVIGDQDAAFGVDLQPVRPTVIFGDLRP
jgi:hypothetical protein